MGLHGLLQDSFTFYMGLSVRPPLHPFSSNYALSKRMVSQAIPHLQTALSRFRLQLGARSTPDINSSCGLKNVL
jgi:hypothetical protein